MISRDGTFLFHTNPRYEFPAQDSSLHRIHLAPDFVSLMKNMREQDAGQARATDFDTGQPATFFFAKIAATGGHFVLVQFGPTDQERLHELTNRRGRLNAADAKKKGRVAAFRPRSSLLLSGTNPLSARERSRFLRVCVRQRRYCRSQSSTLPGAI